MLLEQWQVTKDDTGLRVTRDMCRDLDSDENSCFQNDDIAVVLYHLGQILLQTECSFYM